MKGKPFIFYLTLKKYLKIYIIVCVKYYLQKENGKEVEKVYYVDDNGNIEGREFTQTQKEVTFKTNHFSKYAILYKTTVKKPIIEKAKTRNSLAKT